MESRTHLFTSVEFSWRPKGEDRLFLAPVVCTRDDLVGEAELLVGEQEAEWLSRQSDETFDDLVLEIGRCLQERAGYFRAIERSVHKIHIFAKEAESALAEKRDP